MTPRDLKAWRASMGYTQREAAAALAVTLPTYQSWERGLSWAGKPIKIRPVVALACAEISRLAVAQK